MRNSSFCKEYNAIDILKLVLAIFVMVIHSGLDKTVISPVLRTAVPLFFIISSYFFFYKNQKLTSRKEKSAALGKLVKRNLALYLFWAILQLPLQFVVRGYHRGSLLSGVWCALREIVLGNGFTGSWYIVALVISVIVISFLSPKIASVYLLILTLPLYFICCLVTNYYNLFDVNSFVQNMGEGYHNITGLYLYTSFPVALFWVSLGKVIAEKNLAIKTNTLLIVGVLSAVLLGLERYWIVRAGLGITDDCYFILILICPVIFLLVRNIKFTINTRFPIREMSTLLYVTHGSCGRLLGYILKMLPINIYIQIFLKMLLSFVFAFVLYQILRFFREEKHVKLFKFVY